MPSPPHTTREDSLAELLAPHAPALRRAPSRPAQVPAAEEEDQVALKRMRRVVSGVTLVQSVGLAAITYVCLFNLSVVRGSSMAPSIHDGDRILIDPVTYLFSEIQHGDIVVLQYPLDPSIDYIKRVIGLPGDEILIDQGHVWVNDEPLDEPYVLGPDPFSSLRVRVKPAHYFVLGDNRARSSDSREFGQVPQGYVRGKVEVRVWPPGRAGRI